MIGPVVLAIVRSYVADTPRAAGLQLNMGVNGFDFGG